MFNKCLKKKSFVRFHRQVHTLGETERGGLPAMMFSYIAYVYIILYLGVFYFSISTYTRIYYIQGDARIFCYKNKHGRFPSFS